MRALVVLVGLLGGCTVYTYDGPPPVYYSEPSRVYYSEPSYWDGCTNLNPEVCRYRQGAYHSTYRVSTVYMHRPDRGYHGGHHRGHRSHHR